MLGRVVPIEKGSNEAASTSAVLACCSSNFSIWSNANTADKTFAEAIEFFPRAGDGACIARWLVVAGLGESGEARRSYFIFEVHAHRLVHGERAYHGGSRFGKAEGLPQSRFWHEP